MSDKRMHELLPCFKGNNSAMNLMSARMGHLDTPKYKPDTVSGANDMAKRLKAKGGFSQ
jgi:hypothetical protein